MRVSTLMLIAAVMLLPFALVTGGRNGLSLLVVVFLVLAGVLRGVEAVTRGGRDI